MRFLKCQVRGIKFYFHTRNSGGDDDDDDDDDDDKKMKCAVPINSNFLLACTPCHRAHARSVCNALHTVDRNHV